MKHWIINGVLVTFFLFCFAVGLRKLASDVSTNLKALRVRWLYGKGLSRLDGCGPE